MVLSAPYPSPNRHHSQLTDDVTSLGLVQKPYDAHSIGHLEVALGTEEQLMIPSEPGSAIGDCVIDPTGRLAAVIWQDGITFVDLARTAANRNLAV